VDIVLGVSLAPDTVRLVVIEGQDADGATVEQDQFAVAAAGDSATSGAVDQVIAAIIGTREGAADSGYQLVSTGVTWTDQAGAGALRDAVAAHDVGSVMLVSPLLAAAALAQSVGAAIGYEHVAMLFVEPESATLAVVEAADGSIVDMHRHQLTHVPDGAVAAELAAMLADLDNRRSRADGVFLIGCGTDIVPLKPALEAATSLEVTASEEPDMALARGAALASANAPLFASTTAALAYALDPGTGELNTRALVAPTYLDVSANAELESDALAYSAVDDDDGDRPGRGRSPLVLAGSALAAVSAVVAGALAMSLTSDRPTSAVQPSHPASVAPSQPPQAQAPAPAAPPPAPTAQVAAPPPPAPVPAERPAPAPVANAAPPAPVHRAPPRRAPEYVPTPVQQAAPAPPPEAPPPAPPPAAPAPPPASPQQPPLTMYLHFPFVTVPIPITPPAPPPPAP
jgi:hypothetical protein